MHRHLSSSPRNEAGKSDRLCLCVPWHIKCIERALKLYKLYIFNILQPIPPAYSTKKKKFKKKT